MCVASHVLKEIDFSTMYWWWKSKTHRLSYTSAGDQLMYNGWASSPLPLMMKPRCITGSTLSFEYYFSFHGFLHLGNQRKPRNRETWQPMSNFRKLKMTSYGNLYKMPIYDWINSLESRWFPGFWVSKTDGNQRKPGNIFAILLMRFEPSWKQ